MRFLELNLQAFGPFTDVSLDLSEGGHGLHIIYGSNEAGKSSSLRAIHAALFGIHPRTTDNFIHTNPKLRVGGTLLNAAGDTLKFLRRKGNKETLLNPDHAQGGAHSDQAIVPFLQGVDDVAFSRIFGIGHDVMREGGSELQALRGLVGDSLFAASVGGPGLTKLIESLREEAKELYSSSKKSKIRAAADEYKQVAARRKESEMRITRWQDLQKQFDTATKQRDEVVSRLRKLRTEKEKLERMRSALRGIAEQKRLLEQQQRLSDVRVLPTEYSTEKRSECQSKLAMLRHQIETLSKEIDGNGGLRAKLKEIVIPEGLLDWQEEIAALQETRGAVVKGTNDSKRRLRDRDQLRERIKQLLRDIDEGLNAEEVEKLRLRSDQQAAIRRLANDEQLTRKDPQDKAIERRRLEALLEACERESSELGARIDTSELQRTVDAVRKLGDVEGTCVQLQADVKRLQHDADSQLKQLGLWSGELEEVERVQIPLRESIDRFEDEFSEQKNTQLQLQRQREECEAKLESTQHEIETLKRTDAIPTEEELRSLRVARDESWERIRELWLSPASSKRLNDDDARSLADDFAQKLGETDSISDRLRREADRVAQLATCQATEEQQRRKIEKLSKRLAESEATSADVEERWRATWQEVGIALPLSTREMLAWSDKLHDLKQTIAALRQTEEKLDEQRTRHDSYVQSLTSCIADVSAKPSTSALLSHVLDTALCVLDDLQTDNQRRDELDREVRRTKMEIAQFAAEETQAQERFAAWNEKWRVAMREIGCPDDAPGEQANERLSQLNELFKNVDSLRELDARIEAIEADARDFAAQVTAMCERVAPELSEADAAEAATELRKRLERASNDDVRRRELTTTLNARIADLHEAEKRAGTLQTQLDQFCRMAGVSDDAALSELEMQSAEYVSCTDKLSEVKEQLMSLCIDGTVESLTEEIGDRSADELGAELAALDDQIAEAELERDRLVANVRDLENDRNRADGSAVAAEADEEGLGILARMQVDASRYMKLRVAAALLRQQIDRHRAENQDPLLDRASKLFAQLTCDAYQGLRTDYDDADQPRIIGVRASGEPVDVTAMSDGTRDQLFLALRLAYVERRLEAHEPMPFVVDDILIHFDDDRAIATLKILEELSKKTQVIFFTHHKHLVDLATAALSVTSVFLHQLDAQCEVLRLPRVVHADV